MDFDEASTYFDLYVDWERRLAKEMPFLLDRMRKRKDMTVADVACGSGMHAVAFAKNGFEVTAIDANSALLDRTRKLAEEERVDMRLEQTLFSELPGKRAGYFDAAVCLGNSLSLVPPGAELAASFQGIAGLLKNTGLLIAHTLNYPSLAKREGIPWGPVRALDDGTLLMKGFIPHGSGPWDALFIHVEQRPGRRWISRPVRFQVHPHSVSEMTAAAESAGLKLHSLAGGFDGRSIDDTHSADLVYQFEPI